MECRNLLPSKDVFTCSIAIVLRGGRLRRPVFPAGHRNRDEPGLVVVMKTEALNRPVSVIARITSPCVALIEELLLLRHHEFEAISDRPFSTE